MLFEDGVGLPVFEVDDSDLRILLVLLDKFIYLPYRWTFSGGLEGMASAEMYLCYCSIGEVLRCR